MYLSPLPVADVPATASVTVTSTVPADSAGAVAVIEVAEFTVTLEAVVDPNLTVSPDVNPVPVTVTDVPPAVGPLVGLTAITAGGATYVYWSALLVDDEPPLLVTVTSTVPAASAGAVAVIDVAEFTVTLEAAVDPNLTVFPEANPLPLMVTDVPPAVGPLAGLTAETVGAVV